jgi:hypothetical protein
LVMTWAAKNGILAMGREELKMKNYKLKIVG